MPSLRAGLSVLVLAPQVVVRPISSHQMAVSSRTPNSLPKTRSSRSSVRSPTAAVWGPFLPSSVHGVIPINDGPFVGTVIIRGLAENQTTSRQTTPPRRRFVSRPSPPCVPSSPVTARLQGVASGIVDQRGNRLIVASRNSGTELSHLDSPGIVSMAPSGLSEVVYTELPRNRPQAVVRELCRAGYTVVGEGRPPVASFLDVAPASGVPSADDTTSGSTTASVCGIALVILSGGVTFDLAGGDFTDRTIGSLYNNPSPFGRHTRSGQGHPRCGKHPSGLTVPSIPGLRSARAGTTESVTRLSYRL